MDKEDERPPPWYGSACDQVSMFGQIIMFGQVDNSYGRLCPSAGDSV